jgi:thiol-disulfide isomerase/thioredoxin
MDYEFEVVAWCQPDRNCDVGPSPLERGAHLSSDAPHSISGGAALQYGITRNASIVIWHHPSCSACRNSEPLFSALEKNQDNFVVYRMVATPDIVRQMVDKEGNPHITMLPTYDLLWPHFGVNSVYGSNWRLVSVLPNDLSLLQSLLPSLKGIMQSSR